MIKKSSLFSGLVAIALFANHAPIVWVTPFPDFVFFAVFCAALVTGQHLACEAVKCFFVYLFLHNCKEYSTEREICQV